MTLSNVIKWGVISIVAILVIAWFARVFFAVLGTVLFLILVIWLVRFAKAKLEG